VSEELILFLLEKRMQKCLQALNILWVCCFLECHDRITSAVKASGGLRERLFNVAYNAKKDALEKGEEKCLPF
jgi:hypothetical protein